MKKKIIRRKVIQRQSVRTKEEVIKSLDNTQEDCR